MKKELKKLKFTKIANYTYNIKQKNIECKDILVDRAETLYLVYVLVANNKIMYIGKTKQGYIRPLGYHKNNVMLRVKDGITQECKKGGSVDVFVRTDDFEITFEKININVYESLETALIQKFNPEWNKQNKDKQL